MKVDRRGFVASVAGMALGAAGRLAAQQPGAADPLPRPDVIGQTRRVVDSAQNDPVIVGIERRLGCICPCGLDVFTCRTTDFTCTYSPALHDEVVAMLGRLGDPEAVIAAFVAKYGEEVLLAPKAEGFGAVGYALPGGLVAVLGAALAWVLVRRSRRAASLATPAPAMPRAAEHPGETVGTPDELARLDRALRDLET